MTDTYTKLLAAARDGNEEQIRELMRIALSQGGPSLPVEHFAMGFALGTLDAQRGRGA